MLLLLGTNSLLAQDNKFVLSVEVTDIKELKGLMAISVYNETGKFLSNEVVEAMRKPVGNTDRMTFEFLVPAGRYAVAVYHDKNENKELDTNFVGFPSEPFGFSNNPTIVFGPPSFEKASFIVGEGGKKITINL